MQRLLRWLRFFSARSKPKLFLCRFGNQNWSIGSGTNPRERANLPIDIRIRDVISVNVLAARCLELSLPPTNGNPEPSSVSLKGFMRTRISLPSAIRTHVRPFSLVAPAFILLTTLSSCTRKHQIRLLT